MTFRVADRTKENNSVGVSPRCPDCRQMGTLESIQEQIAIADGSDPVMLASRRCTNPGCHAHVFVVLDKSRDVLASYPPDRVGFDASSIPERVLNTFEEAITCDASNAFVASAIMVRRTFEASCADRAAEGTNL